METKEKPRPSSQEKLLEVINKGLLRITHGVVSANLKEIDAGIMTIFSIAQAGSCAESRSDGRQVLAGQDPLVIHGARSALQRTQADLALISRRILSTSPRSRLMHQQAVVKDNSSIRSTVGIT